MLHRGAGCDKRWAGMISMLMRGLMWSAVVALASLSVPRAQAHGDMHLQIVEVTKQIEQTPKKAELYLRRGELSRAHQDWDSAQADYDRAQALDPHLAGIDFARGSLFLEANWLQSAQVALDRFLAQSTNHVEALVARARTLVKLNQPVPAARDYGRALAFATEPRPDLYIERALALSAGDKPALAEALQGLDEGIRKLGPLITLQLYAIDLEVRLKHADGALARLDQVMAQSPRKEAWLARRGEILQEAGRAVEAKAAFEASLKAIASLPTARRHVPAMEDLEKRLRSALETLGDSEKKPEK